MLLKVALQCCRAPMAAAVAWSPACTLVTIVNISLATLDTVRVCMAAETEPGAKPAEWAHASGQLQRWQPSSSAQQAPPASLAAAVLA